MFCVCWTCAGDRNNKMTVGLGRGLWHVNAGHIRYMYRYIADYSSTVWRVPGMCNWQCKVKLRRPLTPSTVSRSISLSIYMVRFETGQQRFEKFETFTPQATQRFTRSLNPTHNRYTKCCVCNQIETLSIFKPSSQVHRPRLSSGIWVNNARVNTQNRIRQQPSPERRKLIDGTNERRRLSFRSKRQQGILKCWKILWIIDWAYRSLPLPLLLYPVEYEKQFPSWSSCRPEFLAWLWTQPTLALTVNCQRKCNAVP